MNQNFLLVGFIISGILFISSAYTISSSFGLNDSDFQVIDIDDILVINGIISENDPNFEQWLSENAMPSLDSFSLASTNNPFVDPSQKFDTGFQNRINDLILNDPTGEHEIVIIVNKNPQQGFDAQSVAKANKDILEEKLKNVHGVKELYKGKILSFITAKVKLQEISQIAEYDFVRQVGDGQLETTQLGFSDMTQAKTLVNANFLPYNGTGILVGVIDLNILAQHDDLPTSGPNQKISQIYSCNSSGCTINGIGTDDHDTRVAGIIAGLGINNPAMKGVAPGSNLIILSSGFSNIPVALDQLLIDGGHVATIVIAIDSASFKCPTLSSTLTSIEEAVDEGLAINVAMGNQDSSPDSMNFAACAENVISVGSVDDNNVVAIDSSVGPTPDNRMKPELVAPGVDVTTTNSAGSYSAGSGTSFAAPFVSGASAILKQATPQLSPLEIKSSLLLGADWTGNPITVSAKNYEDNPSLFSNTLSKRGFGLLDVQNSLDLSRSGDNIKLDSINESLTKKYSFNANQGDQVKIILSWLNHPEGTVLSPLMKTTSNLDFDLRDSSNNIIMSSKSQNQTNEFVVFTPTVTDTYTVKVTAPFIDPTLGSETFALASTHPILGENPSTVALSNRAISPGITDYYEGEKRIVKVSGKTFAFYHDGSSIVWKKSLDSGKTWSGPFVKSGTGGIQDGEEGWTVYNGGSTIFLIWPRPDSDPNRTDVVLAHGFPCDFGSSGICWDSFNVTILTYTNNPGCSEACTAIFTDNNGDFHVAIKFDTSAGWKYMIYRIFFEVLCDPVCNFGFDPTVLPLNVSTNHSFPMTLSRLSSFEMLFTYVTNESSEIFYRVSSSNGQSWGSIQTTNGTGLPVFSIKQISSKSDSSSSPYLAYLSNGTSGNLTVAKWSNTGIFQSIENVDNTLSHSLPSITASGSTMHLYSISDDVIYHTSKASGGSWQVPSNAFSTVYSNPDRLTAPIGGQSAIWMEGTEAPFKIMYATPPAPTVSASPVVTTPIADVIVLEDSIATLIDLSTSFNDEEDGPSGLTYSVFSNDNPSLVTPLINGISLTLAYAPDEFGEANITIQATDSDSNFVQDTFTVTVISVNDTPPAIYVASRTTDEILRYDRPTGNFLDTFVTSGSGGLNAPQGLTFGSDDNLYVSSGLSNQIIRYDGITGNFIDVFSSTDLSNPIGLTFGSNGDLYVANKNSDSVVSFDGTNGASLGVFGDATKAASGLDEPNDLTFGPDGNLYVTSNRIDNVLRFDGTTGVLIDEFVLSGSGGLNQPHGLDFAKDNNLYVSSAQGPNNVITRYNGTTGNFIDVYATGGALDDPKGIVFDDDDNFYITNEDDDNIIILQGPNDTSPGSLIGTPIPTGSGGLNAPWDMIFGPFTVLPNNPPVANDDNTSTPESTPIVIDVLANDTDADNDPLTVFSTVPTSAQNGTVTNNGNDITYTPPPSFNGTDSFTYIATDGTDQSNVATVTIDVTPAGSNNTPIANAGNDQIVTENTLVQLNGTASFDPDSDPITFAWTKISGPKATLSDPTSATPTFTAPNVGPNGKTIEFQLIVNDGTVDSVADVVIIDVINN